MKFGLEQNIIEAFIEVFETNVKVDKALIFGSRAKGNYRPDSDIDISIKGHNITTDDIISLSIAFEAKGMTHKVDLIDYNSIKEPALKEHIDRVGIEFYSRWKKYIIRNIINVEYGKGLQDYQNGKGKYDVFGTNGKIGTTNEFLYNEPSVIIGRKGAYREVHFSKKPFYVIDTAFYTKNKISELDTSFLYYWFKTININEMDSGSAIPSTSRDELYDLEISLPPVAEQKNIASILNNLDEKIDLLYHQNNTLEQLAETLFKQWFVKDESAITYQELGKIASVGTGKVLKREEFDQNGKFPVLGANGIIGRTNKYLTDERMILTGRVGTLGKVFTNDSKVWISDNVLMIKPNNAVFFYPIYFSLLRIDFENLNVGSTQPLITQTDIKKIALILPEQTRLESFSSICSLYFEKITRNTNQIRTLNQTRNALLPKLMSGEVRVSE